MPDPNEKAQDAADWSTATWQGATREAMRRWAKLPLERIIASFRTAIRHLPLIPLYSAGS